MAPSDDSDSSRPVPHPLPERPGVACRTGDAREAYWRQVAEERDAALRALRGRFVVRAALAIERRAEPLTAPVRKVSRRVRAARARGTLAAAATLSRASARRRAAALQRAIAAPAPAGSDARAITVVVVGAARAESFHATGAAEVIPVAEVSAVAAAHAAERATGDLIAFVRAGVVLPQPDCLARLAHELRGDVGATTPLVVHPARPASRATPHDQLARGFGLEVFERAPGFPSFRARGAGTRPDEARRAVDVVAAAGACVMFDAAAYRAAHGLRPFADFDLAVAELTWRMHASGVRVLAVPGAVVVDPSPVASLRALRCAEVGTEAGRRELVDHHGPALLRGTSAARAAEPTRLAITVAAPSAKLAPRWGDWHLAHALARGVERLGHDVTVATLDRADTPQVRACDVHIVMRGLAPVRRTEGQRHVLWVISHPETITATECDAADLVLVASERFASELRRRTKTPVEVFLQATDHHRFRQIAPVAQHAHPVAVVAKTRDVMRPIVADALAAGIRPAIYGSGWERFVDKDLVVAQYVANDELPAVYSSVGVLLNDHWDTMREWGFVSNRLFDALACGTPVVSDHLDEIASLFAGAVPTYREANDLGDTVRALLADEAAARAAAAQGRQIVLDAHTFDHRARQLFNLFARCGVL